MYLSKQTQSNIQEFFKNKSVFVTGGTGFLGKLIVNKLIRSCPQIKHVYMLIRTKKGKTAQERLEDIFKLRIFKDIDSSSLKKISALSGDCSQANLGLSDEDLNTLIKDVNVIFHSAATVRFDERLDIAIGINLIGTREIVKLAHRVQNLESYLHVSTAYSNCNHELIEEKFYYFPFDYETLIYLYNKNDLELLKRLKSNLLGTMPNTYVMTKAAAEKLILCEGAGLPVTIFRPSIVIATENEPMPGWIDNLYGPTGIVASVITGILKSMPCKADAVTDLVPADLTVNALIAASWDANVRYMSVDKHEVDPLVYNFVSSPENPLTWRMFSENLISISTSQRPTTRAIWYPTLIMNKSRVFHQLIVLMLHYLPAFLLDLIFFTTEKKFMYVDRYRKIDKFIDVLEYFSTREWVFCNKNVQDLWNKLNNNDKTLFPFDIKKMHWKEYLDTYHNGIMTFLFKEGEDKLPAAKKYLRRLYICHTIFKYAFYILIMMFIWMIIKKVFL